MPTSDYPQIIRETWAAYEAARRLGYTDDQVSFHAAPTPHSAGRLFLHVRITDGIKEFFITVGELTTSFAEARDQLEKLCAEIREGGIAQEDGLAMWRESEFGRDAQNFAVLAARLKAKGLRLPALDN